MFISLWLSENQADTPVKKTLLSETPVSDALVSKTPVPETQTKTRGIKK